MNADLICFECNKNLYQIKQYYMVNDDLWNQFGVGENLLCTDCFEKSLGRRLLLDDFTFCTTNAIYLTFNRERHL